MYTLEKPFEIDSIESASEFLQYFYNFHDGFVKRFVVVSRDEFTERNKGDHLSRGHVITNEVVCRVDIAHYNYGAGGPPYNRVVSIVFEEFEELDIGFNSSQQESCNIQEIKINTVSRKFETDPNFSQRFLEFKILFDVCTREHGWQTVEHSTCLFNKAVAWEEDWEGER